ncbi:MAG TPA: Tim44-like domain-containing protein, partial [Candidatus Dojkabacteria bacterium]|nr:Tim44-like domain-containing protein [Candidatus Dojkabacteria bacterium]
MKKSLSKYIVVLLTILVLFLFPAFVFARAGGGESFGGGGYSSGGGSSFDFGSSNSSSSGNIDLGSLGWLFFLGNNNSSSSCCTGLFWIFIIIIIILVITRSRRGRLGSMGSDDGNFGDGVNNTNRSMNQEEIKEQLDALHKKDPDFDLQKFKGYVKKVFMAVQQGWTDRDQKVCRPFMTEDIYQSHDMQIHDIIETKIINVLKNIVVGSVDIARIDLEKDYDKITVKLRASMKDYKVNEDQPDKPVDGTSKDQLPPFTEYWVFIRKANVKTKIKDGLFSRKCPNCGAPISVSVAGVCKY